MDTGPVVVDPRSSATAVSPVSIDAVQVAVTAAAAASDSVTVKVTPSPSLPSASPTFRLGVAGTAVPLMAKSNAWLPATGPHDAVPES